MDYATVDGTAVSATDYIHTTDTVTFTAGGSLTQTITIPVVGDFSDESDELFNLVLSNIQAGGEDVSFSDDTADGNIQDDDGAGVTVTNPGDAINIIEGGVTDSLSIVLDSQPTDVVTMTIATDDQVDLGSGAGISITLTFTPSDWDDAQVVTVTAVNDPSAEGLHTSSIDISSTSSDAAYAGFTASLTATITDNDSPGVTIIETGSNTAVSESGPTDSYELVLATMPTDNVDVLVTPDDQIDLGNGAGNPVTLTFTPANWDDAQVVTITAVNDKIDENTHNSIITHTATSDDADYDGVSIVNVSVTVSDNDLAGVTITEPGGNTAVDESGTADAINVVLDSQPTANVAITLTPDAQVDLGSGAGNAITLTFTPANWDDVKSVTVTAVDDNSDEGNHSGIINYTISSADAFYDGMSASDTAIEITDNDEASSFAIFIPIIIGGN